MGTFMKRVVKRVPSRKRMDSFDPPRCTKALQGSKVMDNFDPVTTQTITK